MRENRIITSYSARLGCILMIILFLLLSIIATSWYISSIAQIKDDFIQKQENVDIILRQAVVWIDRGSMLHEKSYEPQIRRALNLLLQEYLDSENQPDNVNLTEIKRHIEDETGDGWDFYIIQNGILTHSTNPAELGLNLKKIPDFYSKLEEVLKEEGFVQDRMIRGKIYAYMQTPEDDTVLEIGRLSRTFLPAENKASYNDLYNILPSIDEDIISLSIYNSFSQVITHKSWVEEESPDLQTLIKVRSTFNTHTGFLENDEKLGKVTTYTYLPVIESDAPMNKWLNLVGKIEYTTENLNKKILIITGIYIIFLLILTVFALVAAYLLSRYLSRPINRIVDDLGQIAKGDLDHRIQDVESDEMEKIEQSVSLMVRNLKHNIQELEQSKVSLKEELNMRIIAEEMYHRLYESSHDAIFLIENNLIRDCNTAGSLLLNRNKEEIIGKGLYEFVSFIGPDGHGSPEWFGKILSLPSWNDIAYSWVFTRPDDTVIEVEAHFNHVLVGEKTLIQAMVRDVTEMNEMIRRERRALSQLEENLVRLATLNDQIRNPLTIMAVLSEYIGGPYEAEFQNQICIIDKLINQVDISFEETQKIRLFLKKHYGISSEYEPKKPED